jgi:hypothetical protein
MSYGIHFIGYPRVLEGYCDANWISDADELYATSGYTFLLRGGVVSWKSCKHTAFKTKLCLRVLEGYMLQNRGDTLCCLVSVKSSSETHLTQNCQFKVLSIDQLWLSVAIILDGCST